MVDAALRPGTRKCHSRAPDAVQAVATACPVQRVSGAPLILGRYTTLLVMLGVGLVLDATMRKFQRHFLNWAEEAGASRVAKVATPRVIPRSLSFSPVPRPRRSLASGRATRGPGGGDRLQRGSNTLFPASEELGPPPSRRTTEIQTQAPPRRNRKIIGARIDLDVKRDLRRNKLIKAEHARSHHYSDSIELITSWKARHVSHLLPRNCVTEQCRRLRGESGGQRALVASCRASVCWNYFFLILARSQLARSFSLRAPAPSSNQIGSRAASSAVKS